MLTVAVTGGLCAGKTRLCRYLNRKYGCAYVNADTVVHRLQRKNTACYTAILALFGPGIVDAHGRLRRKKIASLVFADRALRGRLNRIMHPAVMDSLRVSLARFKRDKQAVVLVEVPLLFEAGLESFFDLCVSVAVADDEQMARVRKRFAVSSQEASRRIRAHFPQAIKNKKADYVIHNPDDTTILKREAETLWQMIRKRKK